MLVSSQTLQRLQLKGYCISAMGLHIIHLKQWHLPTAEVATDMTAGGESHC